ncbi:1,4-alpha-glucan branching enzyme [Deinococcus humi]|uniref:1,4-alpha-glucan branching enzyme GlgB n=1 Tax=Deinococcus humi TaxID=662880 RepID=A0A7W8JS16_9DEIO|nr:1,4-alpha-glucan branching enzyme [Deinococcus humi]GGO21822.1 1,4-alpha-glucan branching enzyme GlgB [Deinococcus humi]
MTPPLPLDHEHLQKLATADLVRPDHLLGAHPTTENGVEGVRFAVWAPNATHVSVVGDFNDWNGFAHAMNRLDFGCWGVFVPAAHHGQRYKFRITGQHGQTQDKMDPYGTFFETRPATGSIVWNQPYEWSDGEWMQGRSAGFDQPVSIYECHAPSWGKRDDGWFLNYRDLAHRLGDYLEYMGYTHVELLGVMEHPFDGSWGYQVTGYYAPTSRMGNPEDFKYLVDHLHRKGIGVILDWVPGHFPTDPAGLATFDGGPLFEYADPRKGFHQDWNTLIFDYGRNEVVMFLIGSAVKWLQDFHVDGLRVDAVASMLYLDFSRTEWIPNIHGGRENLEAIAFLKRLNEVTHHMAPGVMMIAEESTSFAGVTTPAPFGLGFDYKWAMGWMNDNLGYFKEDPLWRAHHHHALTFFNVYRTSENYVLAISHDEVVHLKKSMVMKMPGEWYAQRAQYRAFLAMMWTTPGKKLLFMGQEFGQSTEWNHDTGLPWYMADQPDHRGIMNLVRRLNELYVARPDWHVADTREEGMLWISADDAEHSVYAYLRRDPNSNAWSLTVANLTPVYRDLYPIGVPQAGDYRLLLSTDDGEFGGFGTQQPDLTAKEVGWNGQTYHLRLNLPPNSVLVLEPVSFLSPDELVGIADIAEASEAQSEADLPSQSAEREWVGGAATETQAQPTHTDDVEARLIQPEEARDLTPELELADEETGSGWTGMDQVSAPEADVGVELVDTPQAPTPELSAEGRLSSGPAVADASTEEQSIPVELESIRTLTARASRQATESDEAEPAHTTPTGAESEVPKAAKPRASRAKKPKVEIAVGAEGDEPAPKPKRTRKPKTVAEVRADPTPAETKPASKPRKSRAKKTAVESVETPLQDNPVQGMDVQDTPTEE